MKNGPNKGESINCVVFGLTGRDDTAEIPRAMRNRPEFSKVIWFGVVDDCDYNLKEKYKFQADYDYSIALPQAYVDTMSKALGRFLVSSARRNTTYFRRTKSLGFGSTYQYLHHFNRYCYLIYDILVSNNVNLIVIDGAPHTSIDVLLCQAADYFKIQTIYVYQPELENKFMYFTEAKEGRLDFSVYYTDQRPIKSKHTYTVREPQPPFFMKKDFTKYNYSLEKFVADLDREIKPSSLFKSFGGALYDLVTRRTKRSWHDDIYRLCQRLNFDFEKLEQIVSAFLKTVQYERYSRELKALSTDVLERDHPFVYFPLATQPETTTECQAGQYIDLLTAVEKVSLLLPDDWIVCLKEHRLQYELARDPVFFQRLRSIPKVVVTHADTPAYDLMKRSQWVATINGTSGLEALHFGKSVLNFGSMYYNGLTGVTVYGHNTTMDDVTSNKPDKATCEREIGELIGRMETGVVNESYSKSFDDYDHEENSTRVVDVICRVFEEEKIKLRNNG